MTEWIARRDDPRKPFSMPVLLSFVAGYLDTYTYLTLFGLFAAQVTGSFVIAGAEFVASDFGIAGKLLAIVAFLVAAAATTACIVLARDAGRAILPWMLGLEALLLAIFFRHRRVRPGREKCARLARHRRWPVRGDGYGCAKRAGAAAHAGHSADQRDDRQYDPTGHCGDRTGHNGAAFGA